MLHEVTRAEIGANCQVMNEFSTFLVAEESAKLYCLLIPTLVEYTATFQRAHIYTRVMHVVFNKGVSETDHSQSLQVVDRGSLSD